MAADEAKSQPLGRKERRQLKEQARLKELEPLHDKLNAEDPATQLEAARELRTLLEGASPPSKDAVIHADLVPGLLKLSQAAGHHEMQFEALWALTDLTSGTAEQTQDVADHGAVEVLDGLLASPDATVREQAVGILANIAAASIELRDLVVSSGAPGCVMKMLHVDQEQEHRTYYDEAAKVWKLIRGQPEQPITVQRVAARCLAALCQGEPRPSFGESMKPLLHTLEELVMSTDEEVLAQACAALSYLQYGTSEAERLEVLVKDGVCARLVELLSHPSCRVRSVAARAAEKIATGSGRGMEAILQWKPVPALKAMLGSGEAAIQRDACSVTADILVLGGPHLEEVVDAGCAPLLVTLLRADEEEVRQSAARAVSALSTKCSPQQAEALITADCVAPMVAMLEKSAFHSSADVGRAALDFVGSILRAGKQLKEQKGLGENPFAKMVKDADGVRMLQAVTEMSDAADVCAKAKAILESDL